jgi:endonuclease-3 related protein
MNTEKHSLLLINIYDRLMAAFGPQGWWPGDTPLEISIGAILTQNTNWQNAKIAIDNLKNAKLLTSQTLYDISLERLKELIKASGFYRQKAERVKIFMEFFHTQWGASFDNTAHIDTPLLREELLSLKGIGPETADSIVLYALNRPVFVVDTYTRRMLFRHNIVSKNAGYDEIQEIFHRALPCDEKLFNEYHALIVRLGKFYCKSKKQCKSCPLEDLSS